MIGDPNFPILVGIIFFSYMIGATTGFGSAVIALTFAVNFFPMHFLIPVVVPLNVAICGYLVIRHHADIRRRVLIRQILPPVCVGMPIGIYIFDVEINGLKWAFGLFVLCISLFELVNTARANRNAPSRPLSGPASLFWLLGGGIVQGLWVSGGPLVAYWAGRSLPDKGDFRSTLSCLFLILNVLLLFTHLFGGRINPESLLVSLVLLPVIFLGIAAGERLHVKLPEKGFRVVVFSVLVFAGAAIVLRS